MPMYINKTQQIVDNEKLAAGFVEHLGKTAVLTLDGKKRKVSDVVDLVAACNAAMADTSAKHAEYVTAVAKEREVLAGAKKLLRGARKAVLLMYGTEPNVLEAFGVAPPKARRELTSEETTQKVAKAKATRAARHTLGPKQKLKIKGSADAAPPPAIASDASSSGVTAATPVTTPVNGAPAPSNGAAVTVTNGA